MGRADGRSKPCSGLPGAGRCRGKPNLKGREWARIPPYVLRISAYAAIGAAGQVTPVAARCDLKGAKRVGLVGLVAGGQPDGNVAASGRFGERIGAGRW